MKVLKFGGSSVGTADRILNVKKIIESTPRPVIVVVSALRGITDQLIKTSNLAAAGNEAYRQEVEEKKQRHYQFIADVIPAEKQALLKEILVMMMVFVECAQCLARCRYFTCTGSFSLFLSLIK